MSNPAYAWVYKTKLWEQLRASQRRKEPLCRFCAAVRRKTPATIVDHIKAHKGDRRLAFDADNLQSLCKPCHDKFAQQRDLGFPMSGTDDEGYPVDPRHPWGKP